jgi:MFS family permease
MLAYGIAMGTLGALMMPARDALLTRVVRRGRERAIAVTSAGQFIFQLVGIMVGGCAGWIGARSLLVGQAVLLAAGALAVSRLAPAPPTAAHRHDESRIAAMRTAPRGGADRIFPVIVQRWRWASSAARARRDHALIVRDVYGGGSRAGAGQHVLPVDDRLTMLRSGPAPCAVPGAPCCRGGRGAVVGGDGGAGTSGFASCRTLSSVRSSI